MTEEKFIPRVTLKDVRVTWVNGELKRNGEPLTPQQVCDILKRKHESVCNFYKLKRDLTNEEIYEIIYFDESRYRNRKQPIKKSDILRLKEKELNHKTELLELKKTETLRSIEHARNRREQAKANKSRIEIKKEVSELMENSTPADFSLDFYTRMPLQQAVLAIQSKYPLFTTQECRLILGSWIRRGL